MKRLFWVALAVLLVSTAAMADPRETINKPNLPNAGLGEIYDTNNLVPSEHTVKLPSVGPEVPPEQFAPSGRAEGPQSLPSTSALVEMHGASLVAPRGAAMSSPEQQAAREIHRLIRKLD
jgi:hypothetical protein